MAGEKVSQEYWSSYIVPKLFKENPHLKLAVSEDQFVKGGSIVYLPQAGAKPGVVKNRSNLPASATRRVDSAVFYPLDVWTTDPTLVTWAEAQEISYAKQDSVMGDHVSTLVEVAGDEMIYAWVRGYKPTAGGGSAVEYLPANRIFATSGAAEAVNPDDGQTGNRKAFSYKDLQRVAAKFTKENIPKTDRYAMLESYMYQQFIDSLSSNQMAAFQATADLANGIVGKFAGFSIMERSSVLAYTATGDIRLPGEALGATDNLACLCWHKNSVAVSMGDKEIFEHQRDPINYGDVISALIKMGGRCRREDWKGIAAIRQTT